MRLTLRTLLAYLDDTLEPTEAKAIGQKVAESDTAQELIARIREVTRRRRITTPTASGAGSKVDPNSIAEYLDNELSAEALAEVEQVALASDVHLAEIAACHQILTIVLGEPAVVPPTAVKRMYGLVKAPESDPLRQPPSRREIEEPLIEGKEVDETLRLGLPQLRAGGSWGNRLILLAGAACILALLGVAIWQLIPTREGGTTVVKGTDTAKSLLPLVTPTDKKEPTPTQTDTKGRKDTGKEKPPDKGKEEVKDKEPDVKKAEDEVLPANLTSTVLLGQYEPPSGSSPPSVLLQLVADKKNPERKVWSRLLRKAEPARVQANAPLVSLPGYHSIVQLDSGVRLTLWGNIPEIWPFPPAFESRVTLHPSEQVDLDLTLERGRIAVANNTDKPLKVRVRFANPANAEKGEVWDITLLEKGTQVIANLAGVMQPGELFFRDPKHPQRHGPIAVMVVLVQSGAASLKVDFRTLERIVPPPDGPAVGWDSISGQQKYLKVDALPPWANEKPPLPPEMDPKIRGAAYAALVSLNTDLSASAVDIGLINALDPKEKDVQKRRLAVRSAGALDDLKRVIDAMADKDIDVRRAANETLRVWIAAGRDNDYRVFDELKATYTATDAEIIMSLLHFFSPEQDRDPALHTALVQYLTHKKTAVRELAYDYLLRLYPAGSKIGYDAVAAEDQRNQRSLQWQKLVQAADKK